MANLFMSQHETFAELFGDSDSQEEDDFEGFEDEEVWEDEVDGDIRPGDDGEWHIVNVSGTGPRGATEVPADRWLPHFPSEPGPSIDFTLASEVDIFYSMFSNEVISYLVGETNRYADTFFNMCIESNEEVPSYLEEWKNLTEGDMKAFMAIIYMMGIDDKPNLQFYWSTHWLFSNPGISKIMPRNKFILILKFFHCSNTSKQIEKGKPGYDKCFKVRGFLDLLLPCWQNNYTLGQHISIDEGMIAFKGRVSIIQYMPKKPIKWGFKAWILSDSKTAYTYDWQLYTGKDLGRDKKESVSEKVILDLIKGLENKGHIVYCDNYYSSPKLFTKLGELGTGACGTVRINRVGLPKEMKPEKRKAKVTALEPGPLYFRKDKLLAIAWYDKKPVYLLTTVHDSTIIQKRIRSRKHDGGFRLVDKPTAVDKYNTYMSGVDKGDQLFTYYGFHRRSLKWWKKIAFHFFEISMVNSWIIYHQTFPAGKNSLQFRIAVIEGLLDGYTRTSSAAGRPSSDSPMRLTARHFIKKIVDKRRPDCRVCSNREKKRRRQTSFECVKCNVSLCPDPCFEIFHTVRDYKGYFEKHFPQ